MGNKEDFVEKADWLAGVTTIVLISLGVIQIILGETLLKSVALTANGIDCIGDGFVSGVVWIGLMFFKKPANEKFHYGYYKMENLGSGLAAVVMIGLAIYIVLRSFSQLTDPHTVEYPLYGALVAGVAAIIALSLGIYKYYKGKKSKMGSVKLEAFNTIKDGVASGLTVVALILAFQGIYVADAVVGFIIAGIIVVIGITAIKESSLMLIDACDNACIERGSVIKIIAEKIDGVDKAHMVRLRQSGPVVQGELEIEVNHELSLKEFNAIKNKVKKKVQEVFPEVERLTITLAEKEESE